jgi:hypothetical protein
VNDRHLKIMTFDLWIYEEFSAAFYVSQNNELKPDVRVNYLLPLVWCCSRIVGDSKICVLQREPR